MLRAEQIWDEIPFLSTPSARRATLSSPLCLVFPRISIHALREEGDPRQQQGYFRLQISIHALREEGDEGNNEPEE